MARKIKFALEMSSGVKVRGSIEELRENFDLEKAIGHFLSGRLVEWLEDRYYEEEAETVKMIDKDVPDLRQRLCAALGVEYAGDEEIDIKTLERINEKKTILRQKTSDENMINNASKTAFNQEELSDLLDMDTSVIYLFGESFNIPTRMKNKKYVGILGKPKINIKAKNIEELENLGIILENMTLPEHLKIESEQQTNVEETKEEKVSFAPSHNEKAKNKITEMLNWLHSDSATNWGGYIACFIPAIPDSFSKSGINDSIREGAKEFKRNLKEDMKDCLDNKIFQLSEAQKEYKEIFKSCGFPVQEITPTVQEVTQKLKQMKNCAFMDNVRPSDLGEALVRMAKYDEMESAGFSGVFGGTDTFLANDTELANAGDKYAKNCLKALSKSAAGVAVKVYLESMEENLQELMGKL